jgi:energy-coupling factor transport system ATP-binding protein
VKVTLENVRATRGSWSLAASGVFQEGIHLVCGDVGSGKTSLALLLAGLSGPVAGTVRREGIATVMMAFQFPEFHVTETDLPGECRAWGVDPAAVIAVAGLSGREAESPLDLSRGELKRLILGCVLARDWDLLLLDEPFGSLDCREKEKLCQALSRRRNGITILFTHEQTYFPRVDRIWEIGDGVLHDRGCLPAAIAGWDHAPPLVKRLVREGRVPANLAPEDLREAACRI